MPSPEIGELSSFSSSVGVRRHNHPKQRKDKQRRGMADSISVDNNASQVSLHSVSLSYLNMKSKMLFEVVLALKRNNSFFSVGLEQSTEHLIRSTVTQRRSKARGRFMKDHS